jgi:glycosyltransferase involved in cell wall biosynthesis
MTLSSIHILRKLDPAEWGGTETALQRLFEGLREQGIETVAYCPRLSSQAHYQEPPMPACQVRRFRAFVPVLGLSRQRRRQMVAVGGNLMSFDLLSALWRQQPASLIHTHTLGRLGGVARTVARRRHLPFIVSVHGGVLDLPEAVRDNFHQPVKGWEWGKLFGWCFGSRRLLRDADAVITCNQTEAALLRQSARCRRVEVLPHAVPLAAFQANHRPAALAAFPEIRGRQVFLCVGRIDPIKNQAWLLEQAPAIFQRHPDAILVLAGACTDEAYGEQIRRQISQPALRDKVLLTGGLPSGSPSLIGLFQNARAVLLPSRSETFGLVILEAWAAGVPVLASRASGPANLLEDGINGWLFDLDEPQTFHEAFQRTWSDEQLARQLVSRGSQACRQFSPEAVANRLSRLYRELVREKLCAT